MIRFSSSPAPTQQDPGSISVPVRNKHLLWNSHDDEAGFRSWAALMADGLYEDAWRVNDTYGKHWPSAHQLWNGKDLRGTHLYLHGLHGFGDVIQMARFLPLLSQRCARVTCVVPEPLTVLMDHVDGSFVTGKPGGSFHAQDMWTSHVEFMELPHMLRLQLSDLPMRRHYLRLPLFLTERMAAKMGNSDLPRIGLVWRGGPWDPERWTPFSALEPLFSCVDVQWWSLQATEAAADIYDRRVRRFDELVSSGSVLDLAAAISNLDLLITTDTFAAHVAGAMGIPTWIMLKRHADWRWMCHTRDSPWYPSVRLFRQEVAGNWGAVVQQVRTAVLDRFHR